MDELQSVVRPAELPANGQTPAVSIGMPVYNGAKYIRKALDSLLAQTFTDFELVISDNASTDDTQDICEEYAHRDARIRYMRQRENLGGLPNFQFVLMEARGNYFMWAACDDEWDKNWILSLKNALEVSGAGAAFGKLMHIDESSQFLRHPANGKIFEYRGSLLKRRTCYYTEFERYGKANPIYSLFRKSVLHEFDLKDYSVDFHIVFSILLKTEIISAHDVTLYKRIHAASGGSSKSGAGLALILRRLLQLLMPLDIGFVVGYFRYARRLEALLFMILLPLKLFLGYVFYLNHLALMIKPKYLDVR